MAAIVAKRGGDGKHNASAAAGPNPATGKNPVGVKDLAPPVVNSPQPVPSTAAREANHGPEADRNAAAVASNSPSVASNKPSVASNKPSIASNKPSVASNNPSVASNNPPVASNEPFVATLRAAVLSPCQVGADADGSEGGLGGD